MNVDSGPLISLLLSLGAFIASYLAKNSGLVTRGIGVQVEKAQQTVSGASVSTNGLNNVTSAAIKSQTLASRLLLQRVDTLERETIRRLDEILLRQSELGRRYDERFTELERQQAELVRRVYKLEHPDDPAQTSAD